MASDKKNTLAQIGIFDDEDPLGNAVSELFRWSEISNGERILTEESFNFALDAFDPGTSSRNILTLQRAALLEWLHSLDLIWSRKSEEQEFNFCPLISDLVVS